MAADLDYIAPGLAAVVSRIETPWHREGTILPRDITFEEAIRHGGLDWEVVKVPHFAQVDVMGRCAVCEGSGEGPNRVFGWGAPKQCQECGGSGQVARQQLVQSRDAFSVVRTDRNEVIGTVGSVWTPLQNIEAFGPLKPLVDDGIAVVETAGSLRRGKQVWMLVRFSQQRIFEEAEKLAPTDELQSLIDLFEGVLPYALFTTDHSGGAKARAKETAIRVVCSNTFDASMGANEDGISIEVPHTASVAQDYEKAVKALLGGIAGRMLGLGKTKALLEETRLALPDMKRLVLEPAVPILHLERKIQRREDTHQTRWALERAHEKREEILNLWRHGQGQEGAETAWDAFQGLVEWTDHSESAATNGRVQGLMDGTMGRVKNRVGRKLIAHATAKEVTVDA